MKRGGWTYIYDHTAIFGRSEDPCSILLRASSFERFVSSSSRLQENLSNTKLALDASAQLGSWWVSGPRIKNQWECYPLLLEGVFIRDYVCADLFGCLLIWRSPGSLD